MDEVYSFLGRFVAYPSDAARIAHTLWIGHTHLMDVWESTPRIAFLSPEPASGKSRCLEVSEFLVPRAIEAVNVSPAYLFRKIASTNGRPTILFDEVDTVFGPKAKENEETRGLLNAGHRKGAHAGRCFVRGKTVETEELPAYCAVALAGIGDLPDTILTRSVIIRMRRRAPDEEIEPWRRRVNAYEAQQLGDRLAEWSASVEMQVSGKWPEMPPEITDRNADVWEALLSVADAAGGEWPKRARVTAVTLVTDTMGNQPSFGIQLLADVQKIMGRLEVIHGKELLSELINMEESVWAELKGGKALTDRGLAYRLRRYGIEPKPVRAKGVQLRGYAREDFYDAWKRYLPPSPKECVPSVTSVTVAPESGQNLAIDPFESLKKPSLRLVMRDT